MNMPQYVRFFQEFGIDDVALVGGKNASLGEMFEKLSGQGVRIPHGFTVTPKAYRYMASSMTKSPSSAHARHVRSLATLRNLFSDAVSGASSQVAARNRSGSASLEIVRLS